MGMARRECVPISAINQSTQNRRAINLSCWRLCERLTIHQAAVLTLGDDPVDDGWDKVWERDVLGYAPMVAAIISAAERGSIKGIGKFKYKTRSDGTFFRSDEVDPIASTIEVDSFRLWLTANGLRPAVFFPNIKDVETGSSALPPYLDKEHPRFASKLNAAIEAWEAMQHPANLDLGRTPRQALEAWLFNNATRLDLVSKDGEPIKQTIEDVAKIANWNTQGGAPRTGVKLSSQKDVARHQSR